jgi:vancomycin resistance protein YoaR
MSLSLTSTSGRHDVDISTLSDQEVQTEIKKAEHELLEARSKYTLRNQIIQNVIITDPILKAVHSGANATELERRLLPLIIERDTLAMVHSVLSTKLQTANSQLTTLERKNIQAIAENKELAREMLELANELKAEKIEEVEDARLRKQLEKLEDEVKEARIEWRVMKSLVAGIVAGSGVDWNKDPKLLSLVLDEEDELG